MRYQSSGSYSCLPSHVSYLYEQRCNAMRQRVFAQARAGAEKRKLRDDDPTNVHEKPSTTGRVVIDEFGNRVVVDRLKRMRVSSPPTSAPTSPPHASQADDIAMDDDEDDHQGKAIVPSSRPTLAPKVSPAAKKFVSDAFASAVASEPSCRALVVFDPLAKIERMPWIEFPATDDEEEDGLDKDSEEEEHFVRFEELPDDYEEEEEAEAMELD